MRQNGQRGVNGLLIVALIGIVAASITFLIAFVSTQRAQTPNPKLKQLRIPAITPPPRPSLTPVLFPTPVTTLDPTPIPSELPSPTL